MLMSTTHPELRRIEQLVRGGLDDVAADQVCAHLAHCPVCQTQYEACLVDEDLVCELRGVAERTLPTEAGGDPSADHIRIPGYHFQEIPGYRLVRIIHRGGQGVVYEAF